MCSRAIAIAGVWLLGVALHAQTAAVDGVGAPGAAAPLVPAAVRTRCSSCHGSDLITQQRLGRAGWEREVDKMIRWGASVPDAERAALLDALQGLGSSATEAGPAAANDAAGADVFQKRCTGCHGLAVVEQQRLPIAGWRREVDKMVAWGARVETDEREPLIAFLAGRHGLR
ncbi:MAG: hypothetical protein AB7Q29_17995 [Vicinamibacterales bacterium]